MARNDHALHYWMLRKIEHRYALAIEDLCRALPEDFSCHPRDPRMREKPPRARQPATHTAVRGRFVNDSAFDKHWRAVRLDPELRQLNITIPDKPRSARQRYLNTAEGQELVKQDRSKTIRK